MMHYAHRLRNQLEMQACEIERLTFACSRSLRENQKLHSKYQEVQLENEELRAELVALRAEHTIRGERTTKLEKEITGLKKEREDILAVLAMKTKTLNELRKKLNLRSLREEVYGLGTPSSRQVFKPNSNAENVAKRGGARPGHPGRGRRRKSDPVAVERMEANGEIATCTCGSLMVVRNTYTREYMDYLPGRTVRKQMTCRVLACSGCGATGSDEIPGTARRAFYSNTLIAHVLKEHYWEHQTMGSVTRRFQMNRGTFMNMAHRSAALLEQEYQKELAVFAETATVIHADETPWSMDGVKSYAWFFGNDAFRIFRFPHTRSAEVPRKLLSRSNPDAVLITDRYRGYTKDLPVKHQYCYVHLLRDIKKIQEEFPDDREVLRFCPALSEALKDAIRQSSHPDDPEYLSRATKIKERILEIVNAEAQQEGVRFIQNIFRREADCLYHWVARPGVPCQNNYAERALRPTVISRKLSFGSQSEKSLHTREVLMTLLHTAAARGHDVAGWLASILDSATSTTGAPSA